MTSMSITIAFRIATVFLVACASAGCASSAEQYRWTYIDEATFPSSREVVVQFPEPEQILGQYAWLRVEAMVRETISQRQQWHARRASTLFDLERDSQIFVVYRPVDPDRPPAAGVPSPDLIPRAQQAEHPLRDGASEVAEPGALPVTIDWQLVTGVARAWIVDDARVVASGTISPRRSDDPSDTWMRFDKELLGKMMRKVNDNSFTLVVRGSPRGWRGGPGSAGREPVAPGVGTYPLTRAKVMDWMEKVQHSTRARTPRNGNGNGNGGGAGR
jgi:hypothetical protein